MSKNSNAGRESTKIIVKKHYKRMSKIEKLYAKLIFRLVVLCIIELRN